ncbi:MAG TPA: hypothetical protein VE091_04245 [Gemmatimonadales bacterium]|nr:hypothetical protein [Gemmatimonadales bacterium]
MTLTDHETDVLRDLLHDYLPDLRREVARTDQHEMRHLYEERQDLVERLIEKLEPAAPQDSRPATR